MSGEPGNSKGVGKYCSKNGGQCLSTSFAFFCTVDHDNDPNTPGYCTNACSVDTDCGDGAYCSGSSGSFRGCEPGICGGHPSENDAGVD
jgi:hypothetical protein